MKKLSIIYCGLVAIFLTGCAAKTGNQFLENTSERDVAAVLIKQETTKSRVREFFGDPLQVDFLPEGEEQWIYAFTKSSAKGINYVPYANLVYNGTNDKTKKLQIRFNNKDTVENFVLLNSAGETKMGLFQ